MNIGKYKISKIDVFITISLLLLIAISVYGFFTLLVDAIRYVSFESTDKVLIFSGKNRLYFNMLFAGLGILLGQSYAFNYLLTRLPLKSYYKTQIVNDNQWVIWCVLLLIIKGVALLISFRMLFMSDSLTDLIPLVVYIMLALLGVMFMYSWNGIRRYIFNGDNWVIELGLLMFFVASFSIAHISFINRESWDNQLLNQNVMYTYDINYSKSEYTKTIKRKSLVIDLVIGKNSKNQTAEVFYDNTYVPINSLDSLLYNIRDGFREEEMKWITIGLRADKDLKVREILPVLERLYICGYKKILFYVDSEYDIEEPVFPFKLPKELFYDYVEGKLDSLGLQKSHYFIPPPPPLPSIVPNYYIPEEQVEVYASNYGTYLKDYKVFSSYNMVNGLRDKFKDQFAFTIYFVDINITLNQYLYTKSQIFKAYHQLRNKYALEKYYKSFDELDKEEQRNVRKQYPINIMEFGLNSLDSERMDAFFKEQRKAYNEGWMWSCLP